MNQEIKSVVKKTVKIAGVTCVALGSAALIASSAALKALTEGGKYLADAVKKIIHEEPQDSAPVTETVAEEALAAQTGAEEADVIAKAPATEEDI